MAVHTSQLLCLFCLVMSHKPNEQQQNKQTKNLRLSASNPRLRAPSFNRVFFAMDDTERPLGLWHSPGPCAPGAGTLRWPCAMPSSCRASAPEMGSQHGKLGHQIPKSAPISMFFLFFCVCVWLSYPKRVGSKGRFSFGSPSRAATIHLRHLFVRWRRPHLDRPQQGFPFRTLERHLDILKQLAGKLKGNDPFVGAGLGA